jgi:hypothetical protein
MDALQRALEAAGVEFTNGEQPGVRVAKAVPAQSLEPPSAGDPKVGARATRRKAAKVTEKKRWVRRECARRSRLPLFESHAAHERFRVERTADLLPPSPPSYLSPPAPRHLPTPASKGDTSVHGDGFAGENALRMFLGRSVTFSTDPSGVIGGTKFGSDYQFSPNWLSGAEDESSQPRFR